MTIIEELQAAAGAIQGAAAGGVVRIGRGPGRGAGIVVADGLILTSAHNLRGEETTVTFPGGRSIVATVKASDHDGDLAVLAGDTAGAQPIPWGSAPEFAGTPVWALALPPGGDSPRLTFGVVSSVGRSFRGPGGRLVNDALEHTAPLGRGSSGGPVVDAEGRLVGINTHRIGDGLYLAIPAGESLRGRVDALSRGEAPTRRRLGVGVAPPHVARRLRAAVGLEPRDGVLVREVADDSPAAQAGIRRGDLIVAAGGQSITSLDSLLAAVDAVGSDAQLAITVVRANDEVELAISFN